MSSPSKNGSSENDSSTIAGMSIDSVHQAAERLYGLVHRTPALNCEALDAIAGAQLWLKCENLQHVSAFKARGAMHAVSRLSDEVRSRGVITYSSGNHAQAVARAAKYYGVRADIAMPEDAPRIKVEGVRQLGGHITFAGTTSPERHEAALRMHEASGATIIEPFDHPDIIAGQGTATLEFIDQVAQEMIPRREVSAISAGGPLDALLVPVGGGGLIAGACLAIEGTRTKVYSVEPVGCDALARSMAAGERVAVTPGPTLADGLKPTRVGELNFAIARERLSGCYTVSDEEIGRTLVTLLMHGKVLVEPSGAAALAVALRGELPGHPERVGVILSGGNVAPELVTELVSRYA